MSKLLPAMRPKVKADTYFLPDDNGVFFRNNEGSFRMEGRTIYQWVEALMPMFDGEQSLEQITEGLSEAQCEHVHSIVQVLVDNGFVRDAARDRAHQLSTDVTKRYAHQIAFLEAVSDSGAYRFEQYRNANVLIIGGGAGLTATACALYESGLPHVSVCITEEEGTQRKRLLEYAAYARSEEPMAELNEVTKDGLANDWLPLLEPFQGIIYVSESGNLDTLRTLESLCCTHRKHFVPVLLFEKTGFVGPLIRPGQAAGFESIWKRLHQSTLAPEDRETREHSVTASAVVANVAVFELLKSLAGVLEGDERLQFFLLDLETMEGDWYACPPGPIMENAGDNVLRELDLQQRIASEGHPVSTADLLALCSTITSKVAGIFLRWEEGEKTQLPLAQCVVDVTDPLSPGPTTTLLTRIGSGVTHEEARVEASLIGIEAYVERVWSGDSVNTGQTRGAEGLRADMGIGAGRNVSEAVLRGLRGHLTQQLQQRMADAKLPVTVAVHVDVHDEHLGFLWEALTSVQPQLRFGLGPLVYGFPSVWVEVGPAWYGAVDTSLPLTFEHAVKRALVVVQNTADVASKADAVRVETDVIQFMTPMDVLVVDGCVKSDTTSRLQDVEQQLKTAGWGLKVAEFSLNPMFQEGLAGVFAVSVCEGERS